MPEMTMSRLQLAIDQIVFARNYTLGLLEQVKNADWFRQPAGGVTHIGWQVGHLAYAEYRLTLWRMRGPLPQDADLFSPDFGSRFGANSVPEFDASKNPTPEQIRAILDRVHAEVLQELPRLSEAELDEAVPHPHAFAKTKLKSLQWCAHHEMLHAGQIGLLRRSLGYPAM